MKAIEHGYCEAAPRCDLWCGRGRCVSWSPPDAPNPLSPLGVSEAAPAGWTEEAAVDLAHRAGFSGTCWTMGPYELVHMLNLAAPAQSAPQTHPPESTQPKEAMP